MSRSASVDLPWSMWAMIEKFRMFCIVRKNVCGAALPDRTPQKRVRSGGAAPRAASCAALSGAGREPLDKNAGSSAAGAYGKYGWYVEYSIKGHESTPEKRGLHRKRIRRKRPQAKSPGPSGADILAKRPNALGCVRPTLRGREACAPRADCFDVLHAARA